jgi:NB-ARC domain
MFAKVGRQLSSSYGKHDPHHRRGSTQNSERHVAPLSFILIQGLHKYTTPPNNQDRNSHIDYTSTHELNPKYQCVPEWCQKNPHFIGREIHLKSIREKLCDVTPKEYNHRLAIYSMGGVGKTQIAIEYVMKFETQYVGIYWITASNEAELLSGFQAIANETQCVASESLEPPEIAQAVLKWLYRSKDWLLVLDNLDDISIANGYLPRLRTGGGHVLITTRNPNSLNIPAEGLQIGVHELDEAKELLLQRIQLSNEIRSKSEVEEEATAIVESLGCLALAIEQAAAYIREELKDIFKFRAIYAGRRNDLHNRQLTANTYYKNTVATTWLMSMKAVEKRNKIAVKLLQLFAFMTPDGISLGFLKAGRDALPDDVKSQDDAVFLSIISKALGNLEQFSLISRPTSELIVIHRIVQAVIKDRLSPNDLDNHLTMVCNIGLSAFPIFNHHERARCREYQGQILSIVEEVEDRRNIATA